MDEVEDEFFSGLGWGPSPLKKYPRTETLSIKFGSAIRKINMVEGDALPCTVKSLPTGTLICEDENKFVFEKKETKERRICPVVYHQIGLPLGTTLSDISLLGESIPLQGNESQSFSIGNAETSTPVKKTPSPSPNTEDPDNSSNGLDTSTQASDWTFQFYKKFQEIVVPRLSMNSRESIRANKKFKNLKEGFQIRREIMRETLKYVSTLRSHSIPLQSEETKAIQKTLQASYPNLFLLDIEEELFGVKVVRDKIPNQRGGKKAGGKQAEGNLYKKIYDDYYVKYYKKPEEERNPDAIKVSSKKPIHSGIDIDKFLLSNKPLTENERIEVENLDANTIADNHNVSMLKILRQSLDNHPNITEKFLACPEAIRKQFFWLTAKNLKVHTAFDVELEVLEAFLRKVLCKNTTFLNQLEEEKKNTETEGSKHEDNDLLGSSNSVGEATPDVGLLNASRDEEDGGADELPPAPVAPQAAAVAAEPAQRDAEPAQARGEPSKPNRRQRQKLKQKEAKRARKNPAGGSAGQPASGTTAGSFGARDIRLDDPNFTGGNKTQGGKRAADSPGDQQREKKKGKPFVEKAREALVARIISERGRLDQPDLDDLEDQIADLIDQEILNPEEVVVRQPTKIVGASILAGQIRFACYNEFTLNWLRDHVPLIPMRDGTIGYNIYGPGDVMFHKFTVRVPVKKCTTEPGYFVRLLKHFNPELAVGEIRLTSWRPAKGRDKRGFILSVEIQDSVLVPLEQMNYRPSFIIETIHFRRDTGSWRQDENREEEGAEMEQAQ